MAKLIKILSEKGGSGKSTLSHLIAHGLGSLPRPIEALVVICDPNDEILTGERRYYLTDGRTHGDLPTLLATLRDEERLIAILDAPAGRSAVDGLPADLTLVPFTSAFHDAQRAARQLEGLPDALGVPNRWPSHPSRRKEAGKLLEMFPGGRLLTPVDTLGPVTDLLNPARYGRISTPLSRAAQTLALEVLYRLNIHPFELTQPKG